MAEKPQEITETAEEVFSPYEKMASDTNRWYGRGLDSIKKWVALEKIHGANFSFTVRPAAGEDAGPARPAKRSGWLKDKENFYGLGKNVSLLEEEGEKARRLFRAVRGTGRYSDVISSVTVFGELFGGHYPHPDVLKTPNAVGIQREVLYCPNNRFIAYDILVAHGNNSSDFLDYDVCMQLFRDAGFLYSEPIKTGTLQDMLGIELGFESLLPAQLGLPPLPGRKNKAEGIVVKPLTNTVLITSKNVPQRVIFKRKVDDFHERKRLPNYRNKGRKGGVKEHLSHGKKLEILKYEILALVCEQRLLNTITKRGIPDSELGWTELTAALERDVLESAEEEHEELWASCGGPSENIRHKLRKECNLQIDTYRTQETLAKTTLQ